MAERAPSAAPGTESPGTESPGTDPGRGRREEADLRGAMARYQSGEIEAFEEIHHELAAPLLGWLRSLSLDPVLADDLLQETFLQMHRVRRTYRPGRPVQPWAFGIARNVFLMSRRSRGRRARREHVTDDLPDLPVPPAVRDLGTRDRLQKALRQLPEDQREALLLHHHWGLSFEEIGGTLGVRPGTAKVRAHRGVHRLRELLDDGGVA